MQDATSAEVAPLAVDDGSSRAVDNPDDEEYSSQPPLDQRIVNIIQSAPNRTVRPARVAAELGISVNDACAELCGLLAAVGGGSNGASFSFEKMEGGQDVMVFQFPPDFAQRAFRKRRYDDLWATLRQTLLVGIRVLKIVTAFGLILSLLILCVAAIVGLFAVLVGISRGGEGNRSGSHRALLMRQIRSLSYTVRQLLWFYAVFGPTSDGQDPFMREVAYDLSLVLSCCCGNPASIFYWFRAHRLARRRHRAFRRWGGSSVMDSDVEGVTLVREGSWGREGASSSSSVFASNEEGHRGLLSLAVEFLFGPEPVAQQDASQAWRLRAAVIVSLSSDMGDAGVSLLKMAPYIDYPPSSLEGGQDAIVEQGLTIVAHFNGVPNKKGSSAREDMLQANFIFPELMAETSVSTRYEHNASHDTEGWEGFLYATEIRDRRSGSVDLPDMLLEERYRFTIMTSKQLAHCAVLGVLNLLGVLWLGQSIAQGGVLEVSQNSVLSTFLCDLLMPVLRGYALLFLAIPTARLLVLLFLNSRRMERNRRRRRLVKQLSA